MKCIKQLDLTQKLSVEMYQKISEISFSSTYGIITSCSLSVIQKLPIEQAMTSDIRGKIYLKGVERIERNWRQNNIFISRLYKIKYVGFGYKDDIIISSLSYFSEVNDLVRHIRLRICFISVCCLLWACNQIHMGELN